MAGQRAPIERLIQFSLAVPRSTVRASRLSGRAVVRRITRGSSVRGTQHDQSGDEAIEPVADVDAFESDDDRIVVLATELPIDGYDDLAARQVVDRLAALSRDDRAIIEAYERENRHRSTVLGMIARLDT